MEINLCPIFLLHGSFGFESQEVLNNLLSAADARCPRHRDLDGPTPERLDVVNPVPRNFFADPEIFVSYPDPVKN